MWSPPENACGYRANFKRNTALGVVWEEKTVYEESEISCKAEAGRLITISVKQYTDVCVPVCRSVVSPGVCTCFPALLNWLILSLQHTVYTKKDKTLKNYMENKWKICFFLLTFCSLAKAYIFAGINWTFKKFEKSKFYFSSYPCPDSQKGGL